MKQNILIVEDHELTRFGLKTTFEGVDYVENIYEADSAENAIKIFNENKIDIIIMDLGYCYVFVLFVVLLNQQIFVLPPL